MKGAEVFLQISCNFTKLSVTEELNTLATGTLGMFCLKGKGPERWTCFTETPLIQKKIVLKLNSSLGLFSFHQRTSVRFKKLFIAQKRGFPLLSSTHLLHANKNS